MKTKSRNTNAEKKRVLNAEFFKRKKANKKLSREEEEKKQQQKTNKNL